MIKWENKLEIDNASLNYIKQDASDDDSHTLVISYKSIHVNSYTVFLVNIKTGRIIFKHDSY